MADTANLPDDTALTARLHGALGGDGFDAALVELEALPRERVVAIAAAVLGNLAPSTAKKAALAALKRRHDGKFATRLGLRAQGGRSAA